MIPSTSMITNSTVSGGSVQLTDQSISDTTVGSAQAFYTINSNGKVQDQTLANLETWLTSGSASGFEVRATLTSGTINGTMGTWLNAGTTRSWSTDVSTGVIKVGTFTIEIRAVSTTTTLDSANISLSSDG